MKKKYLRFLPILLILWVALIYLCIPIMKKPNDFAEINYISKLVEKNWDKLDSEAISEINSYTKFYIIKDNGKIVYESNGSNRKNLQDSIKNRDTIIDVIKDGNVVGKVVFLNEDYERFVENSLRMRSIYILITTIFSLIIVIVVYIVWKKIIYPLNQLIVFAERISDGNLEMPLIIHSNTVLREFANSFDIMREKLLTSQINEKNTLKKRKELIASLSHDIKTPIASIKATTELLFIQEDNELKRKKLIIIMDKAEQINILASNLLQSTLDELEVMEVIPREELSDVLYDIIRSADYKNYIQSFFIPSCIVKIDKNRLLQVFDNIINNSYKYANTEIVVSSYFVENYLRLSICDFGDSLDKDEIELVDKKFYRGKNARKFAGSGLGLYICRNIIDKSGGRMYFEKLENKFCITIDLPLA